jgi:hypothetical protein
MNINTNEQLGKGLSDIEQKRAEKRLEKETALLQPLRDQDLPWKKEALESIPLQEVDKDETQVNVPWREGYVPYKQKPKNTLEITQDIQNTRERMKSFVTEIVEIEITEPLNVMPTPIIPATPTKTDIIVKPRNWNSTIIQREMEWITETDPHLFDDELREIFANTIMNKHSIYNDHKGSYYGPEVFESLLEMKEIKFENGKTLNFNTVAKEHLDKFIGAIPTIIRVLQFLKSNTFTSLEFREMMYENQMQSIFGNKELIRLIELSKKYDYTLRVDNHIDKASSKIFNLSEKLVNSQTLQIETIQEYLELAIDAQDDLMKNQHIRNAVIHVMGLLKEVKNITDKNKLQHARQNLENAYKLIKNRKQIIAKRLAIQKAEKQKLLELLFTKALPDENGEVKNHRSLKVAIMAAEMGLMPEVIEGLKSKALMKNKINKLHEIFKQFSLYLITSGKSELLINNIEDFAENCPDGKFDKRIAWGLMSKGAGGVVSKHKDLFGLSDEKLVDIAVNFSPKPKTTYLQAPNSEKSNEKKHMEFIANNLYDFDLPITNIALILYDRGKAKDGFLIHELAKLHEKRVEQYIQELKKNIT